jgi:hypothetical protein
MPATPPDAMIRHAFHFRHAAMHYWFAIIAAADTPPIIAIIPSLFSIFSPVFADFH